VKGRGTADAAAANRAQVVQTGLKALTELARRKSERAYLEFLDPTKPGCAYPTQREFLECLSSICVLFGGNQTGKSRTLLHLDAWDLTGNYPESYQGFRFHKPIDMWIVGETNELVRDSLQKVLFGPDPNRPGVGGLIPPSLIEGKPTARHNISGAFDTVRVKHVSGGSSLVSFKSYAMGRENLQAWTGDVVHVDEEPPKDCWTELQMRLVARSGRMRMSFTPIELGTDVVELLMDDDNPDVSRFFLGALEARHLGQSHVDKIMALRLSPAETEARLYGKPSSKIGKIFKGIDWDEVAFPRFPIPKDWPTLGSLDPGFDHPTGLVQGYKDPASGVIFITRALKRAGLAYHHHAKEMREWKTTRWVHDPALNQGEKSDGKSLTELYNQELQPDWRSIPASERLLQMANNDVEAGIQKVQEMLETGMLLIFDDLDEVFDEFRQYRRVMPKNRNGEVVGRAKVRKVNDEFMDCIRYLVMAKDKFEIFERAKPWWLDFKQKAQGMTCMRGY
jgi:phage terminase large subunit-like protein